MKRLSVALALGGLALGTILIGWFGFGRVFDEVLSIGWGGFWLLVACQMLIFLALGLAWDTIAPDLGSASRSQIRRPWVFLWGRMVRDSAANCLPLTQMGGFVLGARAVTLHGIGWPLATASTIVDVTAETLAQVAFVAMALFILLAHEPESSLAPPLSAGLGLSVAAMAAFIWLQQGAGVIFTKLSRRIAGHWLSDAESRLTQLQDEFTTIYSRPGRLALGSALHLLGWLLTGLSSWITYQLLGIDIEPLDALAIEGLLSVVLAIAVLVPAYAGVQEAAYAGLG
ncbi:MAG: flippase-like domain-containing protein, partial [Acetobacteraceae bacterium]|nr:flippase-like domain-containing protein [Acetobacteraceae bacterium]